VLIYCNLKFKLMQQRNTADLSRNPSNSSQPGAH